MFDGSKLSIFICMVLVVAAIIIKWPRPAPEHVVAAQGIPVNSSTVKIPTDPAVAEEQPNDQIVQTSDTACVITAAKDVKQHDGTVVVRFTASALNAEPNQKIHISVTSPDIEDAETGIPLAIQGKAPLIFSSSSQRQPGLYTGEMDPARGEYAVSTKLVKPGKVVLDCRVF